MPRSCGQRSPEEARNDRAEEQERGMMSLRDAALLVDGRTSGGAPFFTGVSTDTRTLRPGDLFVARRGERFDGHAFLGQAKGAGAAAAMIDRAYVGEFPMPAVVEAHTKPPPGKLPSGCPPPFPPPLTPY